MFQAAGVLQIPAFFVFKPGLHSNTFLVAYRAPMDRRFIGHSAIIYFTGKMILPEQGNTRDVRVESRDC